MFVRITLAGMVSFALVVLAAGGHTAGGKKEKEEPKPVVKDKVEPAAKPKASWADVLDEVVETKDFLGQLTFKEGLQLLHEKMEARGKELPILVVKQAFIADNPDAPDIYEDRIDIPPFSRKHRVGALLRIMLNQLGMRNATYLLRGGFIEITTFERARTENLLGYPIAARFTQRPLDEVVEELSDLSGATILIDPRVGEKARLPVTAHFKNTIALEGAVRLLAEMADLQAELRENVLFITSKAKQDGQPKKSELRFQNRRLDHALQELAAWSGVSIVLDPRFQAPSTPIVPDLGPRPKAAVAACGQALGQGFGQFGVPSPMPEEVMNLRVTAAFKPNVSGETAARILAAQAGLSLVNLGDVLYVTDAATAERLILEAKKYQRPVK